MSEKELKCAYCHAILFDDDDVVFCPECGAPHHRECYERTGECALKSRHGEAAAEPEREESYVHAPGVPLDREGHVCKRCGRMSTSDTLFCPYCGTAFSETENKARENPPFVSFVPPAGDPFGGVDPGGELDGVSVREATAFVRSNTNRYIPLFRQFTDGRKVSWNWAAFLLGPVWLFFRKCYREGFIALLFSVISSLLSTPFNVSLYTYLFENGLTVNDVYAQSDIALKLVEKIPVSAWLMSLGAILVMSAIRVVLGLYGDRIYLSRVKKRISAIKEDDRYEDKSSAIAMSGGCNIISAAAMFYLMQFVSTVLLNFFIQ